MLEPGVVPHTPPPSAALPPSRPPHVITRKAVASWVLYDLANTIFSMGVVSLYFSLWVRDQVGAERADGAEDVLFLPGSFTDATLIAEAARVALRVRLAAQANLWPSINFA